MGYDMNVRGQDLHFRQKDQAKVQALFDASWPVVDDWYKSKLKYGWSFGEHSTIELDDVPIGWTDDMLRDMILLQNAGVRGMIEFYDDFASFFLYKLTNAGLEERQGRVVYTTRPGASWTKPEQIIKEDE